ncbi:MULTISPECIES: hypothetical protein [unclassified Oceanispirochaeta]|uniref:hypothetical protein n=1 Tax=unclassified Oceanispirochaeta TaxID=2635722 RepID=UPI000E0921DE|nr:MULTISPECIES: hypothetical protein [unclassified Oceanispirochaeta]MBF9015709.1 hypothetical protein [Oceanispirochaeta sp. M2]NPD72174.1 hypothetical protein [Oceanispirochaeta sp. M1]RDG32273.1 hypothetical protein DV872_08690 [Oceanispirochaeta sp. M1]
MKTSSFKKTVLICIFSALILVPVSARTVLVHSPSPGENSEEEVKQSSQSAEAGIMDVLFNRGCIVFSDNTDMDLEGIKKMSVKTDSDFAIDWKLDESGLKGRLIKISDMTILEESQISVSDYENLYQNHEELYTVLGTRLCEMLVGELW